MTKHIRRFKSRRSVAALAALVLLLSLLSLTPAARADDKVLLIDFEDGTLMGFDVRGTPEEKAAGTGVLTVVTEASHSGDHSLLITNRRQSWNAPAFNVAPHVVPGATYDISIWVLLKEPERSSFILSTQIAEGVDASYINLQTKTATKGDGWIEMTAQYTYGNDDFITVYVESGSTATEYYVDDFTFTLISEPDEPFKEWNPETDPLTNSKRGIYDDFEYEFWSQNPDEGSMMLTGGGTYTCEWDGFNLLFRTGKKLGSTDTYEEYGTVIMDYAAKHNIVRGSVSYLCMYGWTEDPMIEFYIVENHGDYKPPGGKGYQGSYRLDGSEYEVYMDTRVNQPSIQGTATFEQYFAVRTDRRTEGTITISDHFREWERLGLDMSGTIYEISLCVEGYNSVGNANVYSHRLTIGDETYGFVADAPAPPTPKPTEEPVEETEDPAATEEVDNPSAPAAAAPTPTEAPKNSSGWSWWLILLIAGGVVVVAGITALVVIRIRRR